jgi:hypothetical protein
LQGAGPLRSRVGRRDELRCHLAGGAEGRIVERCQIVFDRALRRLRIDLPAPLPAWHRAAFIGIGSDQARIDGKTFAADQTGRNTGAHDALEHAAEDIAALKALVACA